ncbi:MAG: hypothetical protein HQL63_09400 [Magnetococcales bacterium]|nr:hypothetical protein [Magnetococcales bacterium]
MDETIVSGREDAVVNRIRRAVVLSLIVLGWSSPAAAMRSGDLVVTFGSRGDKGGFGGGHHERPWDGYGKGHGGHHGHHGHHGYHGRPRRQPPVWIVGQWTFGHPREHRHDHAPVCRTFQTTITIDGLRYPGQGTACQQEDGSWKMVR